MSGRLEGKVGIVTGAGSGIGRGTAIRLAAEGAAVVVADIAADRAHAVTEEIRGAGGQAVASVTDVSKEADIVAMVDLAVSAFGGIDILHNNASATGRTHRDPQVTEMDVDDWDFVMAVNVRGTMLGCKHAIPHMIERGGGSIINTSSNSAVRGWIDLTAYGTSKGAVNALTLYVATQYGPKNIRCNALMPGLIMTPAVEAMLDAETQTNLRAGILLPKWGEPDDIASTVVFLASDEGRYVTAQIIGVNGGFHMARSDYPILRAAGKLPG